MEKTHDSNESEEKFADIEKLIKKGLGTHGCIELYDNMGREYDEKLSSLGYTAPAVTASALAELFPAERSKVRILDAAAGTGLAGEEMRKQGFTNMDAVDASEKMLAEAKKKNIYQKIICEYLGENKLAIHGRVYDAVTMSGGMGPNHVPCSVFEELVSLIKPGGVFVNVTRSEHFVKADEYKDSLRPLFTKMEQEGKWALVKEHTFPNFMQGREGILIVYRIM